MLAVNQLGQSEPCAYWLAQFGHRADPAAIPSATPANIKPMITGSNQYLN
jgi:hypothetical protein